MLYTDANNLNHPTVALKFNKFMSAKNVQEIQNLSKYILLLTQ